MSQLNGYYLNNAYQFVINFLQLSILWSSLY